MKRAFTLYGYGKGKVESKVYKRTPKCCPSFDIINLKCKRNDGHIFADFFVYPEEAMLIATALMRAWVMTYQEGNHYLNPYNHKFHKPFMELEKPKEKKQPKKKSKPKKSKKK